MSSGFREFIEQVRGCSDLVRIIGTDVELRPSGSTLKGRSPFHPEKTPSFVVWPATQTWHDFSHGGGLGGDVFAYVQERDKLGFKEAVFQLAERAGLRPPQRDDESWRRELATTTERREIERLLTLAASYYHRALPAEIRSEAFQQHYGFTDEIIDQLQLGWADGHLFDHLTTSAGVSRQLVLKTGLFVPLAGGQVADFFRHRLVFPYWRGGRVVYFTARTARYAGDEPDEEPKYKKLLTHSERHDYVSPTVGNDFFYNEDAARGAAELVITEGIPDCISAMQVGVPCISPGTTRFRHRDLPRLLELTRHVNRVIICNDAEASGAGEAGAIATAAALWAEGREVCIAAIPRPEGVDKIDVNELVATRGRDALADVLAQARAYPEYLLAQIPVDLRPDELDRRLEPVLAALVGRTAIRADAVLDAIKTKFGIRRGALAARMKALSVRTKAGAARPPDTRVPELRVGDRQARELFAEAHAVIGRANERRIAAATVRAFRTEAAPLFVRGGSLVRLERPDTGPPSLVDLNEVDVFGVLVREADWVRITEDGPAPVFRPRSSRATSSGTRRPACPPWTP